MGGRTSRPGWGREIKLQVGRTASRALSVDEFAIKDGQSEVSCFFLKFELCGSKIYF